MVRHDTERYCYNDDYSDFQKDWKPYYLGLEYFGINRKQDTPEITNTWLIIVKNILEAENNFKIQVYKYYIYYISALLSY